jgi:hypothetical protein
MPASPDHPLYRQNRIRFFLDPLPWHRFLAEHDFAFGTRIHGNIAALSAGIPAYLLTFDSRTTELADYHAIPYAPISKIRPDTDPAELYDRADLSAFNARQPEAFGHYLGFLEENGLDHIHQPGKENPGFQQRLAEVNFPAGVGTLYAGGEETTAMLLDRLRWLHQGETVDRERSHGAYDPQPFGKLPKPRSTVKPIATVDPGSSTRPRSLRRRIKRTIRRTVRRLRRDPKPD